MARIAVVDDDPDVRDFVAVVLREAGHEVVTADDGLAVLPLIEAGPPDLLVLDILMPNRDGLETILALRREGRGFPILAISAGGVLDGSYLLHAAKAFGADESLFKPFTPEQLRDSVEGLLKAS
jgi:DNA-binding response OmpR family regulator